MSLPPIVATPSSLDAVFQCVQQDGNAAVLPALYALCAVAYETGDAHVDPHGLGRQLTSSEGRRIDAVFAVAIAEGGHGQIDPEELPGLRTLREICKEEHISTFTPGPASTESGRNTQPAADVRDVPTFDRDISSREGGSRRGPRNSSSTAATLLPRIVGAEVVVPPEGSVTPPYVAPLPRLVSSQQSSRDDAGARTASPSSATILPPLHAATHPPTGVGLLFESNDDDTQQDGADSASSRYRYRHRSTGAHLCRVFLAAQRDERVSATSANQQITVDEEAAGASCGKKKAFLGLRLLHIATTAEKQSLVFADAAREGGEFGATSTEFPRPGTSNSPPHIARATTAALFSSTMPAGNGGAAFWTSPTSQRRTTSPASTQPYVVTTRRRWMLMDAAGDTHQEGGRSKAVLTSNASTTSSSRPRGWLPQFPPEGVWRSASSVQAQMAALSELASIDAAVSGPQSVVAPSPTKAVLSSHHDPLIAQTSDDSSRFNTTRQPTTTSAITCDGGEEHMGATLLRASGRREGTARRIDRRHAGLEKALRELQLRREARSRHEETLNVRGGTSRGARSPQATITGRLTMTQPNATAGTSGVKAAARLAAAEERHADQQLPAAASSPRNGSGPQPPSIPLSHIPFRTGYATSPRYVPAVPPGDQLGKGPKVLRGLGKPGQSQPVVHTLLGGGGFS